MRSPNWQQGKISSGMFADTPYAAKVPTNPKITSQTISLTIKQQEKLQIQTRILSNTLYKITHILSK